MKLDKCIYTNAGGRSYNEDTVGDAQVDGYGIFVLCDGLGGHALGQIASRAAVDTIIDGWQNDVLLDRTKWLPSVIKRANRKILELQRENHTTMKTTVVALVIDDKWAVWANTGDSRLYYIHRGELVSVTEDHSVAYKKFKAGEITREEIGSDEDQGSLLRTLGNEDRYEPSVYECEAPLEKGDAFMLCSDGAWEYLSDYEVLVDYHKAADASHWMELMLIRIFSRVDGRSDNLSMITVMVD